MNTPGRVFWDTSSFCTGEDRRSSEDLERFVRKPDDPHLPAWRRFNQAVGADGSVGIWHETYMVERAGYEAIYSNMPLFGLARATEHVPAIGRRETARTSPPFPLPGKSGR
jgi:hypothetical protein